MADNTTSTETITVDLVQVERGDYDAAHTVSVHTTAAEAEAAADAINRGLIDELRRGGRTSIIDADLARVASAVDFAIPRAYLSPAGIAAFEAMASERDARRLAEARESDPDY